MQRTDVSFAELGVAEPILRRLEEQDIRNPFEIQALVIPDALAGRDILGQAKTGAGKTLAFGVPLVQRMRQDADGTQALVLVPTRELCAQVADDVRSIAPAGTKIVAAYGGVGMAANLRDAAGADMIIATPGRLIDLLDRRRADLSKLRMLVIDEADRMADMGFLPQVGKILRWVPRERQTMLFSATLDAQIIGLISQTQNPVRHEVTDRLPTVEGVEHHLFEVHTLDKEEVLVALLRAPRGLALVFTRTKRNCDKLAARLRAAGIRASEIHGDLGQVAREKALTRFERGDVDVLVATEVAARGLDIDGITHVVNYDPPEDHKAYLHRVGRTARAGRSGVAITLATWTQRTDVERMARRLRLQPHIVEVFSTDPVLQRVGTGEVSGAPPADEPEDAPTKAAVGGAYAKLAGRRGGRRRR